MSKSEKQNEGDGLVSDALLAPIWYALGSIVATPLLALMMLVFAAFLVCAWPFIPFLCWGKRREEVSRANDSGLPADGSATNSTPTDTEL